MMQSRVTLTTVLILVATLAVTAPRAEEGRIPIFEPTTIAVSGSYIVTRDIGETAGPAITILASADVVELDLNGFTVARTTGTSDHVIVASGLTSLKVSNGTIQRIPTSPYLFAGLEVTDTEKLVVEDVNFNRAAIIGVDNRSVTIRRNKLTEAGIYLSELGATTPRTATIEDNMLRNDNPANGNGGLAVVSLAGNPGLDVLVRNNHIKGANGIQLSAQLSSMVLGNRITEASGHGIHLGVGTDGCLIADNVIYKSGDNGIDLVQADGNKIFNNVSSENGLDGHPTFGSGIEIEGGALNHLDGNVLHRNAKTGIYIRAGSVGNTYGRNMADQNGAVPSGGTCVNPAITTCPAPYGTGSAAPDLCDDGTGTKTLCDNLLPGPPRS
ncbi:MAG: right-handed parallel beta-helix repeat-containing protein [bacterium]|nr:right-handed parallel beta-helix repeat-containing protein [bacterium]